jgi:nitrogen fixation NifU-like protein
MDRVALIARLLDHYEHPRNRGPLPDADVTHTGGIPDCGDVVTVYMNIEPPDRIAAVSFEGRGCTISQAAASILSERVIGAPFAAIEAMTLEEMIDLLGREVVETRPRCATLALRTLKAAIASYRMGKTL